MADLFEQLLAFKWRDTEVPVTRMRLSIAHDLVEHKYPGVDGARVEDTGLAPMRISAHLPMVNGIVPGKGEKWGTLYPAQMRQLLADFSKKTTGILQHPEFGEIACKAERIDIDWSGDRRGGVEIEASWVETIVDINDASALDFPSPVNEMDLAALDLDASDQDLRSIVPQLPKYETTFDDLARSIKAVGDQVSLLENRAAGKINSIVYRVNAIGDSIDRAKSALTWPAKRACVKMQAATQDLRGKLLQQNRDIILYVVPADTTLAGILPSLPGATLPDLIRLNPRLVARAVLHKGTIVRFYAPRVQRAA